MVQHLVEVRYQLASMKRNKHLMFCGNISFNSESKNLQLL